VVVAGRTVHHLVGRVEDLPPGSVSVVPVGRYGVGVFNVGGRFYALSNHCPHRGAPLALGEVDGTVTTGEGSNELQWERDGECLRCPWHGWEFDIATGASLAFPERKAKTWAVSVEDGYVVLEGT
jgi:nitrite reductase (NADH) small subunit